MTRRGCKQSPINRPQFRPHDLPTQDLKLVAQHQELNVFHMQSPTATNKRAEQRPHSKVEKRESHAADTPSPRQRSCDTNIGALHAFARLAGCAPIPASSGQTIRYRLDRSGDRQLNRALHMILITRRRWHQPTIDYIARRRADGKSSREANRCLKRYLARSLYRLLEHGASPAT